MPKSMGMNKRPHYNADAEKLEDLPVSAVYLFVIQALLCLITLSCNRQSHWAFDQIHSEEEKFRSSRLAYYSTDPIYGIDLELLNTEEQLNVYLNVHSIPIASSNENPKSASLIMEIEGQSHRYPVYRLAGGQRLLLEEHAAAALIEALKNHKEVSLCLAGYRCLLKPEDFSSKFEKLLHPTTLQNPFRLPF